MTEYDDGAYYEVQLNNKQLVFFFMAALAIAVVVFLCGVMVGRGVHDAAIAATQPNIAAPAPSRTASAELNGPEVSRKPEAETKLDYAERLESDAAPTRLNSQSPETTVRERQAPTPKPKASPPPAKAPAPKTQQVAGTFGSSRGDFTIQVVALKTEDAAQSLLSRLQRKNYRAYLESGSDAGLHRVRVGKFQSRQEAEVVAQKLRVEEKFKPYITQ